MVSLQDLTVGQVSGMIAAAVFIVQFLVPVALPIILLGLLRPRSSVVTETAVSWSVIGRYFQSSLWPLFLQTDCAATGQANKSILFMSFFKTFMMILIAIAAIVTPLGLYEGIIAESSSSTSVFHYIKDASPMGYGTAPRTNNTWSRICGSFAFVPCPNDNNQAEINETRTGLSIDYKGDWYDTRIPQKVIDVFQSGIADMADSVSSSFDIQYRSYIKNLIDDIKRKQPLPAVDNGTARTVGTYQPLASFVLNEGIYPVEGLVIDMKTGGIGFRNHSAPTLSQYGSTWNEDILFIVPETVCVNTNLTLDFQIPRTQTEKTELAQNNVLKPEIIDHGGFVNLNTTYPLWNIDDTQKDPAMYYRAYRGAWLSNAYTMAYMNVTNFANATTKTKAFSYLNSTMGKAFPLYWPDGKVAASMSFLDPYSLSVSQLFGDYLTGTEGSSNVTGSGNTTKVWNFTSKAPLFSNPGNISKANFSTIDTLCRGQGGLDLANITNIATKCGFVYGAPQRKGGSDSPIFDPGSAWSVPMYSCVSATKAMIKTVSFRFNGTKDDLSGLEVVSLTDKKYLNDESKPLWGVEQTSMKLRDTGPLWGLVSKDSEKKLNISTIRKEHLYLPGRDAAISWRNTPGSDFHTIVLDMVYSTGGRSLLSGSGASVDYTGRANLAMYKKWQDLSKTPETSAKILNLIWTDIAANMVVGTKGLQSNEGSKRKRDGSTSAGRKPEVVNYTRRVRYKWPYGIPAFIALVLVAASAGSTFFFVFFAGATPNAMRTILQHTSVGRLLTSQAKVNSHGHGTPTSYRGHSPGPHGDDYSNAPTNVWSKGAGKQQFTLGAEGWMKSVPHVPGYEEKGGATASYAPVPNPQGY